MPITISVQEERAVQSQRPITSSSENMKPTSTHVVVPSNTSSNSPSSHPSARTSCANCHATESPVWRKGNKDDILCNKCGLYRLRYGKNRPTIVKAGRRQKNSSSKKRQVTAEDEEEEEAKNDLKAKKVKTTTTHSNESITCTTSENSSPDSSAVSCQNSQDSDLQTSPVSLTNVSNEFSFDFLDHEILTNDLEMSLPMENFQQFSNMENQSLPTMEMLRKQLSDASHQYPLLMNTLISIIRKHVLNQPNIVAMVHSQHRCPQMPTVTQYSDSPILDSLLNSQSNNTLFMREMEFYSLPQFYTTTQRHA
ncbi:hypothetical protein C9374_012674 [Naegleria lovaniensis]|uniref:GATA-type domain-containing protein n=1 Tax=Naegleria lovaniensis TaxID=51637 RepID=A0AA88KQJ9_NAELO|nr:uncharacterized protein C9374_012674 [Naegleria lovaniensis]KAG2392422.1 hypothetical protein C9374_012674 [Naegleria lovaniensis]